jgi:hypothetical protein
MIRSVEGNAKHGRTAHIKEDDAAVVNAFIILGSIIGSPPNFNEVKRVNGVVGDITPLGGRHPINDK